MLQRASGKRLDVLLINPPYQTITSIFGVGHQVPLGLLMVGGALIDAGHRVRLLDAECHHLEIEEVAADVLRRRPDVVMTGHAGSTPAHPVCMNILAAIRRAAPGIVTVYGGVYPSYHASRVLADERAVDVVIRGEGEATAVALCDALGFPDASGMLRQVEGITFRDRESVIANPDQPPIRRLDAFRTGWELLDWNNDWDAYRCFGTGRAAIVQFSRGCPHRCTYCGQHEFWRKWRHRDPARVATEIEWLVRRRHVRFVTLADENPTTSPVLWRQLLEELSRRRLPVHLFATIRATDIVRDAELGILPLYHRAGLLYVLMGIETTDDSVIREVNKRSTSRIDMRACRLLRENGVLSVLGHIVGLGNETAADMRRARKALFRYEGDFLNAMYVTPHAWTPFAAEQAGRPVVQRDQRKWDYRHQVLANRALSPRRLFAETKWTELAFHLHPRRLRRIATERDPVLRWQLIRSTLQCSLVWLAEIGDYLFATRFEPSPVPYESPLRLSAAARKARRALPVLAAPAAPGLQKATPFRA